MCTAPTVGSDNSAMRVTNTTPPPNHSISCWGHGHQVCFSFPFFQSTTPGAGKKHRCNMPMSGGSDRPFALVWFHAGGQCAITSLTAVRNGRLGALAQPNWRTGNLPLTKQITGCLLMVLVRTRRTRSLYQGRTPQEGRINPGCVNCISEHLVVDDLRDVCSRGFSDNIAILFFELRQFGAASGTF